MTDDQCTKCNGPRDTTGYPKWCRKCRAANKRECEKARKDMLESKGFVEGREEMREHLAAGFEELGSSRFTGYEVAATIRGVPGPTVGE